MPLEFGIMLLDGINQCFPNPVNAPKLPAGVNTQENFYTLDISRKLNSFIHSINPHIVLRSWLQRAVL